MKKPGDLTIDERRKMGESTFRRSFSDETIGSQTNTERKWLEVGFIIQSPNDTFDDSGLQNIVVSNQFESVWELSDQQYPLTESEELLKRVTDILFSTIFGIFVFPVLLLTALMIKIDSPGPVLYKQARVGKNGRRFNIYKFRSMQVNADKIMSEHLEKDLAAQQEWNQTQKLREDPRITRVGKWIREFSVDELPQLFNIFKGDMSIVGPRSIMPEQKSMYGKAINIYMSVKPGLTGFWQVSGRNRMSFSQRAVCDVYYVHNWSFWFDMYILFRTIWVVLNRDGAY